MLRCVKMAPIGRSAFTVKQDFVSLRSYKIASQFFALVICGFLIIRWNFGWHDGALFFWHGLFLAGLERNTDDYI